MSYVDRVHPVSCLCLFSWTHACVSIQTWFTDIKPLPSSDCIFVFLLCNVCFSASIPPISGFHHRYFSTFTTIYQIHNDGLNTIVSATEHRKENFSIFLPNITVSSSASDIIKVQDGPTPGLPAHRSVSKIFSVIHRRWYYVLVTS